MIPLYEKKSLNLIIAFLSLTSLSGEQNSLIKPLESGFFLLPSPVSQDSSEMVRLFTAPVIDGYILEEKANSFEKTTRSILNKKKNSVRQILCKKNETERADTILVYKDQIEREYAIWENLSKKYDQNIIFWLDSDLKNTPYRNLIKEWKDKYRIVSELRLERQTIIKTFWTDFLRSSQKKQFCTMDAAGETAEPREKLFLPLYIAMYRFYEGIPADFRNDLIVSMNSSK